METLRFTKNAWCETHSIAKHRKRVISRRSEQLACYMLGLTSSVCLGLRENSGPGSVFSEPGTRVCASELSHVLIFPAASCKEKHQRSRKVPVLLPSKPLFLHWIILQITGFQKCIGKSGGFQKKVCSLGEKKNQPASSRLSLFERLKFSTIL